MSTDTAASEPVRPPADAAASAGAESSIDTQWLDAVLPGTRSDMRWIGWRARLLVGAALLGCLGVFLLARALAESRHLDATWRTDAHGRIELADAAAPLAAAARGRTLVELSAGALVVPLPDALVLQRSARWLVDDADRERHRALNERVAEALSRESVRLRFDDGTLAEVRPSARGYLGLGAMFVLLAALALVLYLTAMVVMLARPSAPNLLYGAMALGQAGNLLFIAAESAFDLGLPPGFAALDLQARTALDLATAAAIMHVTALHPRRLPHSGALAALPWAWGATLCALSATGRLPQAWGWTQGSLIAIALATVAQLTWSNRLEPHPYAVMLRRFGVVVTGTLALLTLGSAAAGDPSGPQHTIASVGSVIWYVFFASLLLLVPFVSRSQPMMREFSLLAAVSTVATSLDLLFVAVFSIGQFTSLTLSLFLAFGIYAGARQWILNQLIGPRMLTTERMFERLYRTARDVEAHPERAPQQLAALLRELFDPLDAALVDKATSRTRVVGGGSTLLVPVPDLAAPDAPVRAPQSVALRFALRGRRLFTVDDARLTDRVVDQLLRAVAFDKAVERGRSEERARLAQDLHDDIGARLLTLMYKAPSPEMEDYVRHTLQDLKTLTRGLAVPARPLSHAAAEWKADLQQRLGAAGCLFSWRCEIDDDAMLGVVQWSALTRVLRELASNAIAHARATRVDVALRLVGERLELRIADDGVGRNPQAWSHGLGLGGVRKRVKQLGGQVEWCELAPRGIACEVRVGAAALRP